MDFFLCVRGFVQIIDCKCETIIAGFSRSQCLIKEHCCTHCIKTVCSVTGMICINLRYRESRVVKCTALTDKIFGYRAEDSRLFTISFSSEKTVNDFVSSVSALIERESRIIRRGAETAP